ncbi:MAG: hypothetical protein IKY29_01175 [Clostridia bacterium]|nr:hypothetical protein [Clostridia bacterium]
MKRLVTFFLILTALFSLLLCLNGCQPSQPNDPSDEVPTPDVPMVDIVKGGVSQYSVIRSEKSGNKDADTLAAATIRRLINEATGAKIEITDDWEKDDESKNFEILVGRTNRPETALLPETLAPEEYVIIFTGKKILIDAGSSIGFEYAVEYFLTTYLGYNAEDGSFSKSDLAIPENLNLKTTFDYPPVVYVISGNIKAIGSADRGGSNHNDIVRLISSMQGSLNKMAKENDLYVYWNSDSQDTFWLDYISGEDKMLDGCAREELNSWDDVWNVFGSYIKEAGLVVWDPNAPSTANVAATICGVEGYLPVRYNTDSNSLYQWLIEQGVPVKMDLTGKFTGKGTIPDINKPSTGSIKCDPYIWALELYMDKCNSGMIAYVLDGASCVPGNYIYENGADPTPANNQLYSHDYYIYNTCFFIDLTCVDVEAPCDDPDQPLGTDAETLHLILATMQERNNGKMIKFMGFPPWYMKYTTNKNMSTVLKPTELEWAFVEVISQYNCVKEADAAHPAWMTNASIYCQYESTMDGYVNNEPEESYVFEDDVRYFTIYMGDYDSSAWLKQHIPGFFKDPARDRLSLMWGFNPNLSDRVPMIFDYVYENLGNDMIVTGDSGAGYVIPSALPELDTWTEFNMPYMAKFDLDIVGFIINGNNKMTQEIFEAYAKIAPVGSFHNDSSQKLTILDGETVYLHLMNGIDPVNPDVKGEDGRSTYDKMYEYAKNTGNNFSAYRTVVKSPSDVIRCVEGFIEYANAKNDGYTYVYVDPYTLFELALESGQGTHIYSE